MATRSEKVKLGIFLTVAITLLIAGLAVLTGSEVWEERTSYVIRFQQSVSGLEPGAPVKQRGVRVGYVDRIRVSPENVEYVEVWIKVNPGTPIKEDTKAYMNMQGITGLKFVELKGGSKASKRLAGGGEIEAGTSTLQELTGRATDIGLKFEKLLNNMLTLTSEENIEKVDEIIDQTDRTIEKFHDSAEQIRQVAKSSDEFLNRTREPLRDALSSVEKTTQRANETLAFIEDLSTHLETITADANIPELFDELRQTNNLVRERIAQIDADRAVENITVALKTLQRLLEQLSETIGQNQDALRVTIQNLRSVSENLKQLSRTFQEKPYIQIFGTQPKERKLP